MLNTDFINELRLGNVSAYEKLYKDHYGVLCVFANKLIQDRALAESVVSDIMYDIWKKRGELNISSSLRSYLLQSVRNRCFNYIESEKRQRRLKEQYTSLMESRDLHSEQPLAEILMKELDLKIRESLDKLSPVTRRIFLMSRETDLKYTEIAALMDMSVDSVKYHMKSALSSMRSDLLPYLIQILFASSSFTV